MEGTVLNALVVDDEKLARDKLKRLLEELNDPGLSVIGEAKDGLEAIEKIESLKPDVVFLDIQMPGLSGFEVIRNLNYVPAVIFSTAYDQYAIRAFEINATDYLLKPYDKERLSAAIGKLKRISPGQDLQRTVKKIVTDLMQSAGQSFIELLPTRVNQRIKLIKTKDVLWFDTEHSITFAHVSGHRYDLKYTLDELEGRLNQKDFFRTHRSAIVNLHHITEIVPWFNGQYKLILNDPAKTEQIVSRGRAQELKLLLNL
ncbi:LytTR family DNA-binding domain-containing protein [bacterium]|nr:LytTR family DNA-binding domain-containing protein [bacterium]